MTTGRPSSVPVATWASAALPDSGFFANESASPDYVKVFGLELVGSLTPATSERHQQAASSDCRICGWHVWDEPERRDAQGRIITGGGHCVNSRPRADAYGGG
jgi:hypothetical protein